MESRVLAANQSHRIPVRGLSRSLGVKRLRDVSSVHSISKQARHFRLEKKLELRPWKTHSGLQVRAKTSGFQLPGTKIAKKSEEAAGDGKDALDAGARQSRKVPGTLKLPGRERSRPKVKDLVFVAGATGKVGRRVVRELVKLGYRVRAGVRNADTADALLEFVEGPPEAKEEEKPAEKLPSMWANFAPTKLFGSAKKKKSVEVVEIDLGNSSGIEDALGDASVVVCAIGASEKEALNVTGPYEVDFKATKNLIEAATIAKVKHFVLVTSIGTGKIGWPAAIYNLFWGILIWKAKAEKALIESGLPFTIVRPGGMERPTDAHKETHNLVVEKADSRFGGQVSRLQVAELIAGIVSNLELAQDKILEVVAETTAPLSSIEDLLAGVPSISALEESSKDIAAEKKAEEENKKLARRKELQIAKQRADEERLEREEQLAAEKLKAEALRQKLQIEYMDAKARKEEAQRDAVAARSNKDDIQRRIVELQSKAEAASLAARESKALEVAITAASRQGKTLSDQEKKEIVASVRQEISREVKQKEAEEKAAEERKAAEEKAEQKRKTEAAAKEESELLAKAEADKKAKADSEKLAKAEADKKVKAEAEKQAKAEAEKLAKAEAERQAKAEAEKQVKAEAEIQAKIEAEIAAKEEAEKKAKIEAELNAKVEAEEKAKIEAELKAKAEAEEKAKVEAESKARAEAEEKAKFEEEIRAREKAEELAKVEAEAKTKAEADKNALIAAEKRAKDEAEKEAKEKSDGEERARLETERKAKQEASQIRAKSNPFLWPWQKISRVAFDEKPVESTEFPPSPTPLSPYTQYPGLRPPSSPSPSLPRTEDTAKTVGERENPLTASNGAVSVRPPSSNRRTSDAAGLVNEIKVAASNVGLEMPPTELEVPEKSKTVISASFLWPWQKKGDSLPSVETEPESETALSSTDLPKSSQPLSPYWRYPDLKPPTSPTPSAPQIRPSATEEAGGIATEVLETATKTGSKDGFRWPWEN